MARSWLTSSLLALALAAALPAAASPAADPTRALRGLAAPAAAAEVDIAAAIAADEQRAGELDAERDGLRAEAAAAPARIAALEAELRESTRTALRRWEARLPERTDGETLEALLEQERLTLGQLRSELQAATGELARALAGSPDAAAEASDRQRRMQQLQAPADAGPATDAEALARRRAAAELRRLQAEQDLAQTRQEVAGRRQRVLELELRVLRHRIGAHAPREDILQQRIAVLGRERLREQVADLEAQAAAADPADPLLARQATMNVVLGQQLLALNEALADERRALAAQAQARESDAAALANGRTRLELDSRSEQVGIWLWAELRRLEPDRRLRQELRQVRDLLAAQRLRLIGVDEQQRELVDVDAAARALRREQSAASEEDAADAEVGADDPLADTLARRLQLSEQLEPMLWRRVATLEETERNLQARLDANREMRQLMGRHLLWIRSHAPADAAWLATVPDGLRDQLKPARFATTWQLVREDAVADPGRWLGAAAVLALLLLLRRRAPARLDALGQTVRDVREDGFRRTLQSLAWTLLAALPWPAAALLVGALLRTIGTTGKYSDSLGYALMALSPALLTLIFLHWLVRERGLAHAHFRWTRQRREALRQWLPWNGPVQAALYFVVTLAFVRNQELAASVQGRIGVVLSMLAWAAGLAWLLAPGRVWHTRQGVEPARGRQVLRVLVPAACVAAALLALDGYVWSTVTLSRSLFASLGVLVGVAIVHGLLSRWFVLGARRLALKRWLDKRAEEGVAVADDGGEAIPVEVQEEITLEKVGANSRALLRIVKIALLTIGLVVIWGQVALALFRFDEVTLWTVAGTAADGSALREPITLLAVMAGLLVLWLTVVAARNLPGLIEIGLQSRSSVDAASRYAITSVSRYAIVVVGFVVGFGLLGLRWGQLQWMAAALTLGLGFGLQEIFANFVSGLILLFERPFRVGDTITVNGLDGTVTRIRTRATTILDFDNKEIVVPNKSFITGQLVNWTLTDDTTRVVIKVGVDYGTDPALVHRLMLQAAGENARVLKEWPPRSWLMGFGANSLDFELRVFVGTMSDRLAVRNELNVRLIELFDEAGIGFAFPQLDVHVRELPTVAAPEPGAPPPPRRGG